ncbi:MAG: ATPase [Lachnospiraceae bacterium]|nr:ATPase [Lachnospiraceae bacterium]
MREISLNEFNKLSENSYVLIDIRDEGLRAYGMIPGAMAADIDGEDIREKLSAIPADKILVFYCETGRKTGELDSDALCEGRECFSLEGGYIGYVRNSISDENGMEEKRNKAEESIRKKYHKQLFTPFAKACKKYRLIEEGDQIAVCISGGKDSMLMAKLFQEIQKHRQCSFELTFLVMDPGYNKDNRALIESNAKALGIPVTIFESEIFDAVDFIEKSPCYICARMRRGYLYSKAKELGCNKIALGHHYDDVIETILMGMLYGGQVQTMMPKLHSTNFEGMELIRPLYLVREADICAWRDYNDLHFLQCACHFTETCTTCHEDGTTSSKRLETKKLIAALKKDNPYIEFNIFKSVENVNLDTVIAYKKKGVRHHFLDEY